MMSSLLHGREFVSARMVCKNLPSSFAQFSKSMNIHGSRQSRRHWIHAKRVFEAMEDRNVMARTALICKSAQHGFGKEVLRLFEVMLDFGVKPNELTFTGVLSACMNTGLVEEGKMYFGMIQECGLELKVHHYRCIVEQFGRMGMLEEALEMIEDIKVEPNVVVWGSYLCACKQYKRFDMAGRVIERILGMIKPENDRGTYTLICNLYSLSEKWDDAERVRQLMLDQKVWKVRGSSSVENRRSLLACGPFDTNSCRRLLSGESDDEPTNMRTMTEYFCSAKPSDLT